MDTKKLKQNAPVFILWTCVYWGYLYYFYSVNWDFHIFSLKDWRFFVQQWNEGWVVRGADQWIFIAVALFAIPIWYFILKILLPLPYSRWFEDLFFDSIYKRKMKQLHSSEEAKIQKRPSYRQVRPRELAHGIVKQADQPVVATPSATTIADMPVAHPQTAAAQSAPHSSLSQKLIVPTPMSADPFHLQDSLYSEEAQAQPLSSPIPTVPFEDMESDIQPLDEDLSAIMQKECTLFSQVAIKGEKVSYVAVGKKAVYLCQVDDEEGDWLADEEPFNNEAPLWFSDRAHRVSPVYTLQQLQKKVEQALRQNRVELPCRLLLVKTQGIIINAEEMLPRWRRNGVTVCRSQTGGPTVLPSFSDSFPREEAPSPSVLKKVKDALQLTGKKTSAKNQLSSRKSSTSKKKPKA